MEDLIMKMIDIEDKARAVISDAQKADKELEARIKNETDKLQSDIEKKMEAKNNSLRQMEQEDADKKIKIINENTEKHLSELEEKYKKNKDKWVKEIMESIIGR